MKKDLKVLCVCRSGTYRSVETKRGLNKRGYYDVLSVGGLNVSQGTLDMLTKWADVILLAKPVHGKKIRKEDRGKIDSKFYIGSDWMNIVKKQLDLIGF